MRNRFNLILIILFIALSSCQTKYYSIGGKRIRQQDNIYSYKGDLISGELLINTILEKLNPNIILKKESQLAFG